MATSREISRRRGTKWVMAGAAVLMALAQGTTGADTSKARATLHPQAPSSPSYRKAVRRTAEMVNDGTARRLAERYHLNILNLTWEDTGRYKDSSVGPNISDMTIQVATKDSRTGGLETTCMPVIRYPNFSDRTCDLDPRDFTLLVGNQHVGTDGRGETLRRISLYDLLAEPTAFLSDPGTWRAKGALPKTLLAPQRDSKVLVSAQACFLPVPKEGKATFNPVLFNYQSYAQNPAVLTILVTREGTSMTVIDNTRDAFESGSAWGQRLFHNAHGQRASLTGERESDYRAHEQNERPTPGVAVAGHEQGLNAVLLIQVPLKQRERPRRTMMDVTAAAPAAAAKVTFKQSRAVSNVENAVIGHGELEGKFTEIDHLAIERDPRFPVRVTVQFYKATDNGIVSQTDLSTIKQQIDRVYAHSDYVGSLVTSGETGRITEYEGAKIQPAGWWNRFWADYEAHYHISRDIAIQRLQRLLGTDYQNRAVTILYLRDLLRGRL